MMSYLQRRLIILLYAYMDFGCHRNNSSSTMADVQYRRCGMACQTHGFRKIQTEIPRLRVDVEKTIIHGY